MDVKLGNLINRVSGLGASGGIPFVTLWGNRCKFSVAQTRATEFIDGYCALAAEDEEAEQEGTDPMAMFGGNLAEVATSDFIPVVVRLFLRFSLPEDQRFNPHLYGEDFLRAGAHVIQKVMLEFLQISPKMHELVCCVLESRPWQDGDKTCIEVRLHFPYAKVNLAYQNQYLRPKIIEVLRQTQIIRRLEIQPIGDWDVILQPMTAHLPMYRSKDDPRMQPVTVSHFYIGITENQIDGDLPTSPEVDLKNIYTPQSHTHFATNTLSIQLLQKNVDLAYWFPLFLSLNFPQQNIHPKEDDKLLSQNVPEYENKVSDKDPLTLAKVFLPLLSVDRFNIEPYWLDVGQVLYNITDGRAEGLEIWIQASSRATEPGRDKAACTNRYYKFQKNPLTHKTLAFYAKKDSPGGYEEWHDSWTVDAFEEALSLDHVDVAEALYRVFWLDYMCSGSTKNSWVYFDGTRLRPLDNAVYLHRDICDKFIPTFKKIRSLYCQQSLNEDGSPADKKNIEGKINMVSQLIKKLGNQSYQTSIVKMAQVKFYVDGFERYRDADPQKIGTTNYVIECCGNHAYVRPGKPEDFITMSTMIPYRDDYTWEHPNVVALLKWLRQAFPDEELMRFFQKKVASMLYGRNAEKKLDVWTGAGDASKSMMVKCLEGALGMYAVSMPLTLLSDKVFQNSSGPNPELAQMKGAHVGIISEPDAKDDLNPGKVKRFTGGDRQFARMCNQDGGAIEATAKVIYMCNIVPNMPGSDEAARNRVCIIPFLSTWALDAPPTEEEQFKLRKFPRDPYFDTKIPEYSLAMLWMMVQFYSVYKTEGMTTPPIVDEHTKAHWDANDPLKLFLQEKVVYAVKPGTGERDMDVYVTNSELYDAYKIWFRANYPNDKLETSARFKAEMVGPTRLGPQHKSRWYGIRINIPAATLPN